MSFIDFYSRKEFDTPDILKSLEQPLPVTFLLNNTFFKNFLEKYFMSFDFIQKLKYGDLEVFIIKTHKKDLKKLEAYKNFNQNFIIICEMGLVTRQEIVSMMPVHFLNTIFDNKKHLKALDLCASPGSKTLQLMDICDLIIANDVNIKRLNVLTTNICKKHRFSYKKAYTVNTSYDAKNFPLNLLNHQKNDFNIILCDAPCSGDGTIKKNPHIVEKWSQPINIFNLQYRILKRAVDIFFNSSENQKYLSYSTCSLNPLENEFIVNCILEEYKNLELLDLNLFCHEIKRKVGISAFEDKIDISKKEFKRICKDFGVKIEENENKFEKVMNFTERDNKMFLEYKIDNKELSKCARFMPNDIFGGFFIAIFKTKKIDKKILKKENIKNSLRIVNNLERNSIELSNLDQSVFDTLTLLSNSSLNNTLFEIPKKYTKYVFPSTEFAGIIRAEKIKNKPSNTLLRRLEDLNEVKKEITSYRLKNVNHFKDECLYKISFEIFSKILEGNCFFEDLIEDEKFLHSMLILLQSKLTSNELKNYLKNLKEGDEHIKHERFDLMKLQKNLPIGPTNLNFNGLIVSCRISGKVEPYLNDRERKLILYLIKNF